MSQSDMENLLWTLTCNGGACRQVLVNSIKNMIVFSWGVHWVMFPRDRRGSPVLGNFTSKAGISHPKLSPSNFDSRASMLPSRQPPSSVWRADRHLHRAETSDLKDVYVTLGNMD